MLKRIYHLCPLDMSKKLARHEICVVPPFLDFRDLWGVHGPLVKNLCYKHNIPSININNTLTDNSNFSKVSRSRRHNRTFPELQRHLHPAVPEQGTLLLLVLKRVPNIYPQKKNYFNEIHSDFHKRKVIPVL